MEKNYRDEAKIPFINNTAGNRPTILPTALPLMTYDQYLVFNMRVPPITIVICTFGIFSNIVNIVVFYKMGLTSASNISLFLLAIADAFSVCAILLTSFQDMFDDSHLPMKMGDVALLTSHAFYFFSAMCSWITTVISMARTCCIIYPMKVKI